MIEIPDVFGMEVPIQLLQSIIMHCVRSLRSAIGWPLAYPKHATSYGTPTRPTIGIDIRLLCVREYARDISDLPQRLAQIVLREGWLCRRTENHEWAYCRARVQEDPFGVTEHTHTHTHISMVYAHRKLESSHDALAITEGGIAAPAPQSSLDYLFNRGYCELAIGDDTSSN